MRSRPLGLPTHIKNPSPSPCGREGTSWKHFYVAFLAQLTSGAHNKKMTLFTRVLWWTRRNRFHAVSSARPLRRGNSEQAASSTSGSFRPASTTCTVLIGNIRWVHCRRNVDVVPTSGVATITKKAYEAERESPYRSQDEVPRVVRSTLNFHERNFGRKEHVLCVVEVCSTVRRRGDGSNQTMLSINERGGVGGDEPAT